MSLPYDFLDRRPIVIALAGSNGAGKSTFYESFLADQVGEKVDQLATYATLGYTVVVIFIQIDSAEESIKRVAMRVSQGGHDVPDKKLLKRFERTYNVPLSVFLTSSFTVTTTLPILTNSLNCMSMAKVL